MKSFFMFLSITAILTTALFLCACKSEEPLLDNVSELRSEIFYGESADNKLKASYGFRETPCSNDGVTQKKIYALSFRLLEKEISDVEYTLSLKFKEDEYKGTFKLNPTINALTLAFPIEGFSEKSFTVTLSYSGKSENITLSSIVPEGTVNYTEVIKGLKKSQGDLLETYYVNGEFKAELILRVVVKENKSFWYVGIMDGENLKAFLMDGKTLEVLAIREVR